MLAIARPVWLLWLCARHDALSATPGRRRLTRPAGHTAPSRRKPSAYTGPSTWRVCAIFRATTIDPIYRARAAPARLICKAAPG